MKPCCFLLDILKITLYTYKFDSRALTDFFPPEVLILWASFLSVPAKERLLNLSSSPGKRSFYLLPEDPFLERLSAWFSFKVWMLVTACSCICNYGWNSFV